MEDNRTEFEKSLDPNYTPGPSAVIEKPEVTAKDMEKDLEIDHFSRPLVVCFKYRYHALECWSAIKKILETFEVNQQTQGVMMETMSTLAHAIDKDVRAEAIEKGLVIPVEEEKADGDREPAHTVD